MDNPTIPPAEDRPFTSPQIHALANEVIDSLADVANKDAGTAMAVLVDALAQIMAQAPPEQFGEIEADLLLSLKLLTTAYRTKVHAPQPPSVTES